MNASEPTEGRQRRQLDIPKCDFTIPLDYFFVNLELEIRLFMEDLPTLEVIKNRITSIHENHYNEILNYLDFLNYQDSFGFQLTEEHLKILDESSKTPIEDCIPADKLFAELEEKYKK